MATTTVHTTSVEDDALSELAAETGQSLQELMFERARQGITAAVQHVLSRRRQKAKEEYGAWAATAPPEDLAAVRAIIRRTSPGIQRV